MGNITFTEMTEAVGVLIESTGYFKQVQTPGRTYQPIAESIAETPLVQIYVEGMVFTAGVQTDRKTFGGLQASSTKPIRPKKTTVHVDVFARARSNIADDLFAVQEAADVVDGALETQIHKPFFNLDGIEAFTYRIERVMFEYGNAKFSGLRFFLDLTTM